MKRINQMISDRDNPFIPEDEKLIKNRECISCKNFFDCKGKPRKVERCVNRVEREKK